MPFKLTKEFIAERDRMVEAVDDALQAYRDAATEYNDTLTQAHTKLAGAVAEVNSVAETLRDFIRSQADDWRGEFDERSDAWREGERGQAVESWLDDAVEQAADGPEIAEPDTPDEHNADGECDSIEDWLVMVRDLDDPEV